MTFTKGTVFVQNSKAAGYGAGLKAIVSVMTQNIPGLTIGSVTTDTAATYNVTLDYNGLPIVIENSVDSIYATIGTGQRTIVYAATNSVNNDCTVSYMYSDTGVFSVSVCDLYLNGILTFSCIPVLLQMSGGSTKSVLFIRSGNDSIQAAVSRFMYSTSAPVSGLFDPSTGAGYGISFSGGSYPSAGLTGKAVVVPALISSDIGEITSYSAGGESGQFYTIYPGSPTVLQTNYPGAATYVVGNENYVAISGTYFMQI